MCNRGLLDKIRNYFINLLIIGLIIVSCKSQQSAIPEPLSLSKPDMEEVVLLSPWSDYNASTPIQFEIKHVSVNLRIDFEERRLEGVAELIATPHFYDQDFIELDAKGLEILEIKIDGEASFGYEYDGQLVSIELPRLYKKGEQCVLEIGYSKPAFDVPAHASAQDRGGIFMVDYWQGQSPHVWTQAETAYASTWYPTIDSPNQRYTQEVSIVVPDSLETLSNGVLAIRQDLENNMRKDTWKLNMPHAPYLSMVAIGDFNVSKLDLGDVEGFLYYPTYADSSVVDVFSRTGQMINYFEELFEMDYPWPSYNQIIVKDYISGAMENTGAVVFMEDLLLTHQEQLIINHDDIVAHELAHHWFGNLVTCESWANLTLNEAFATYAEQLWNEHYYGQDSADLIANREIQYYLEEALEKKVDPIRFYYEDPDADLFDNHSYAKGARILHMLRLFVGDDAFFGSLSHYLKTHQWQTVEIHDLRMSFEEVTGLDLNWFFQQWFLNAGHPELSVNHHLRNDTLYIEVLQNQDLTEYPLYQLPLYVDIFWDKQAMSYPLDIRNQRHQFRVPAMGRDLKAIVFDSDFQLVGQVTHEKSLEEWIYQLENASQILARKEAYQSLIFLGEVNKIFSSLMMESNELLLVEVMDLILGSEKMLRSAEVLENLRALTQHPNPIVRGTALNLLGDLTTEEIDWASIIENDSVNYVKGMAVQYLLMESDREEKLSLVEAFNSSKDLNLLLPLSQIINDLNLAGYNDWYQQKISAANGSDQIFLISSYAQYLINQPVEDQLIALQLLKDVAKYHIDRDTRLTAFEALLLLSDEIKTNTVRQEIISFERDEQLIEIYQLLSP
jgi:aminopeptidase N